MDRALRILLVVLFGYLFFLAIDLLGTGMKESFAEPIRSFLEENGESFTELRSFVIGILGTALIQSSSTVTSMSVVMVQQNIMTLSIAAGVVHGANLGTSVTSSIVAFFTGARPLTGNPLRDGYRLLFEPRGEGFERAVGTAVVHDFFNIVMITSILLLMELPGHVILNSSEAAATWLGDTLQGGAQGVLGVMKWLKPGTYTGPVTDGLLQIGARGWLLALIGLPLLFVALRGFTSAMQRLVMQGVDTANPEQVGHVLLGRNDVDTFVRGLVLTILVQSSSATTSMAVPLAALGFFSVRKVFPFILGANIGTTTTALLVASSDIGQPGFHAGMTIALCHLSLNTLAVGLAVVIPGLQGSVLGAARWLGVRSAQRPITLLYYLGMLVFVTPAVVYLASQEVAALYMGAAMLALLVAPHVWMRHQSDDGEPESEASA